jgi:hypothetical protein
VSLLFNIVQLLKSGKKLFPIEVPYTTSEKKIGTWIDGKPIYRKTIDFGELPNATLKSVSHQIANLDKCIKIQGIATSPSNLIPLPYIWINNTTYDIVLYVDKAKVNIQTGINRTGLHGYVTLDYTKTTD